MGGAKVFITTKIGSTTAPTLLDTGNLSRQNLLDYHTFRRSFPQQRPKLEKIQRSVNPAGGGQPLKLIGSFRTKVRLADYPSDISLKLTVAQDLGTPLILSAATLHRIPVVLDLGSSSALLGPAGYRIPLRSSEEVWAEDSEDALAALTVDPRSKGQALRLAKDSTVKGRCEQLVWAVADGDWSEANEVVFIPDSTATGPKHIQPVPGIAQLRRSGKAGGRTPILLQNLAPEKRRLRAGTLLGYVHSRPKPKSNLSNVRSQPPKGKEPNYDHLSACHNERALREMLYRFIGYPEATTETEERRRRQHVHELFQGQIKDHKILTGPEKQLLEDVLFRFYGILSKSKYDVGRTDLVEFRVDTEGAAPVRDRLRPMNPEVKKELAKAVDELLKEDIIEPTTGEWASAVVPVRKQDGSWRFAVDYRPLNKITKHNSWPVAHPVEAVSNELIGKAKFFTSLDLTGAYLAIPVRKEDQDKLAMITSMGLFRYLRMPFGARNSGQTYALLMDHVVGDMVKQGRILSYFDDHLITAKTFEEGLFRLAEFLYAVERANLRISPKKTKLFTQEATWLGHTVTAGSLSPGNKLTEALKSWPTPQNRREVMTFIGKCGYYRRFVQGFSAIADPLRLLLKKGTEWMWGPRQQQAFETLRDALCKKPVLAHANFQSSKPFIIDADASGNAVGAVLSQAEDAPGGVEHPIAYYSHTLSPAERNYSVTRKELLAMVMAIKNWRYFLLARPFLVRTDHGSLRWLRTSAALSGQLARWAESLADYDFTVEYRPGKKHTNADALSRRDPPTDPSMVITPEDRKFYEELRIKIPGAAQKQASDILAAVQTRAQRNKQATAEKKEETPAPEPIPDPEPEVPEPMEEERRGEELQVGEELPSPAPQQSEPGPDECQCGPERGYARRLQDMVVQDEADDVEWEPIPEDHEQGKDIEEMIDMAKAQAADSDIRQVKEWLTSKANPDIKTLSSGTLRAYAQKLPDLLLDAGKLYFKRAGRTRICVPTALIPDVVRCLHCHPLAGHLGTTRLYLQARNNFYWPGMAEQIKTFVAGCTPCARAKRKKPLHQVPLGQTSTADTERFARFFADIVGPWPTANTAAPVRYKYLLTFQDAVTKYPEAFPIREGTTDTIVAILTKEMLPRYGTGFTLVTDRGRQFWSALFRKAAERLRLVNTYTQAYEPHTNPVERFHRTIEGHIRALMEENGAHPSEWWRFVPFALAAIRQAPLSNLPASPHYLCYGVEPGIPAQQLTKHRPVEQRSLGVDKDIQRLEAVLERVRLQQLKNHEHNKEAYDKNLKGQPVGVGDWVYLYVPQDTSESGSSRKTAVYQQGPYRVEEVLDDRRVRITTRVQVGTGGGTKLKSEVVSRDRLTKASPFDLSRIPAPLAFPIARKFKARLLPRYQLEDAEPRPATVVSGMPFPQLDVARPHRVEPGSRQAAPQAGQRGESLPPPAAATPAEEEDPGEKKSERSDDNAPPLPLDSEDEALASEGEEGGAARAAHKRPRSQLSLSGDESPTGSAPLRGHKSARQDSSPDIAGADGGEEATENSERSDCVFDQLAKSLFELKGGGDRARPPARVVAPGSEVPARPPAAPPDLPEARSHHRGVPPGGQCTGRHQHAGRLGLQAQPVRLMSGTKRFLYARLHPDAKAPTRGTPRSAGYDLATVENFVLCPGELKVVRTGLRLTPPEGTYLRIAPRSGLTLKNIDVKAGVVDPDFRGEAKVILKNDGRKLRTFYKGDRIAQAILECCVVLKPTEEVEPPEETVRGAAGFGSTDKAAGKEAIPDPGPEVRKTSAITTRSSAKSKDTACSSAPSSSSH